LNNRIFIKLLAISFAIVLLSLAPTVVLAQGNGQGGPDYRGNGDGNGFVHGQQWKDESGSDNGNNGIGNGHDDQAAVGEGFKKHFFGHFNLTDGVADGKFITFAYDESSGNVNDYALRNGTGDVTFFDSIQILGFTPSDASQHGAVLLVQNDTVQLIIHDNPTGLYHVVSNESNTTVSFLLAPGMSAIQLSSEDEDASEVLDHDLAIAVAVFGNGAYGVIATDKGNLTIDDADHCTYVNVTLSYDHVVFRAKPVFSHHHMNEDAILAAISEGRIACEFSLVLRNGVTSYDTVEYRDQFHLQLLNTERDRIQIQVEDQEHRGKVVILNVDQGTFDSHKGELRLELDGVPIKSTTNPLEVLYADGSDASDAIYCIMESEGVSQFLVYIPSFSIHQLSLSSLGPMDSLTSSMGMVAVIGALAIVVVAGFLMLGRRR
jgi:hypothetical protein